MSVELCLILQLSSQTINLQSYLAVAFVSEKQCFEVNLLYNHIISSSSLSWCDIFVKAVRFDKFSGYGFIVSQTWKTYICNLKIWKMFYTPRFPNWLLQLIKVNWRSWCTFS